MAMIEACAERAQPMLGVCLGHQALGVVMGATVGRAPELLHGKTSQVHHDGTGVLHGLPTPFTATRYHSLTIDPATRPPTLLATGHTDTGIIMAVRHATLPLHGVQFHPESVLTVGGHRILANWLLTCGSPTRWSARWASARSSTTPRRSRGSSPADGWPTARHLASRARWCRWGWLVGRHLGSRARWCRPAGVGVAAATRCYPLLTRGESSATDVAASWAASSAWSAAWSP